MKRIEKSLLQSPSVADKEYFQSFIKVHMLSYTKIFKFML